MCLAKVKVISTQKNRSRDVLIREKPSKFDVFIGCKVKRNDVTTVPVTTIKKIQTPNCAERSPTEGPRHSQDRSLMKYYTWVSIIQKKTYQ